MPVIAVLNRKGGSGKSTLASNIAGWCASKGWRVMLGDVDRQHSMRSWLRRRSPSLPAITTWAADSGRMLRPPRGTTHVVLDTPGALYDHELARLLVAVDAVVVPIGPSVFDHDASLDFLADLSRLPRIASGRCQLIAIGMRWPPEKSEQWLSSGRQWAWPLLTVIPDASLYRNCLERGASVFDPHHALTSGDAQPWIPLTDWLEQFWGDTQTNSKAQETTPMASAKPAASEATPKSSHSSAEPAHQTAHPVSVSAEVRAPQPPVNKPGTVASTPRPNVGVATAKKQGWLTRWFVS